MNKLIFSCLIALSFPVLSSSDLDDKAKNECKNNAGQLSEQFISTAFENADFLDKASIVQVKEDYISLIGGVCFAGYTAAKNKSSDERMDAEAKRISRELDNPTLSSGIFYAYFYGTGVYSRLSAK